MKPMAVYVIDTSYLLELYAIPGKSTPEAITEIRKRLLRAAESRSSLYVTVPTIYELAKHIVRIPDGNQRRRYAVHVKNDVLSSLTEGTPWNVIPSRQPAISFKRSIASFPIQFTLQQDVLVLGVNSIK